MNPALIDFLSVAMPCLGMVLLMAAFWIWDRRQMAVACHWELIEAQVYAARAVKKRVAMEVAKGRLPSCSGWVF